MVGNGEAHFVAVVMAVEDESSEGLVGCVLGCRNPVDNCLQGLFYANALLHRQTTPDIDIWADDITHGEETDSRCRYVSKPMLLQRQMTYQQGVLRSLLLHLQQHWLTEMLCHAYCCNGSLHDLQGQWGTADMMETYTSAV